MLLLEALLAAGYTPAVYSGLRQPTFVVESGVPVRVGDPFDPFAFFHASTAADRRWGGVLLIPSWDGTCHHVLVVSWEGDLLFVLAGVALRRGEPCGGLAAQCCLAVASGGTSQAFMLNSSQKWEETSLLPSQPRFSVRSWTFPASFPLKQYPSALVCAAGCCWWPVAMPGAQPAMPTGRMPSSPQSAACCWQRTQSPSSVRAGQSGAASGCAAARRPVRQSAWL